MNSKALHIHIDRLVVEGLEPGSQRQFVGALEAQLATHLPQLAEPAFSGGQSHSIPRVNAGEMRAGSTPERAATQITTALRSAITAGGTTRG
jgi:hypothetical protein